MSFKKEKIFRNDYFFPLFISAKTATTRTMTTRTNTPIIQMPFSHDTNGMFTKDFTMYWF